MSTATTRSTRDLGRSVPCLARDVERTATASGIIRLRGPRLVRPLVLRWWSWLMRMPAAVEVELDDIGSFVVARLDGRPLDRLVEDLAGHLKLTRREAEVALADFMGLLLQRRLVVLQDAPRHEGEPP